MGRKPLFKAKYTDVGNAVLGTTQNKVYDVFSVDYEYYYIRDNHGDITAVLKERFEDGCVPEQSFTDREKEVLEKCTVYGIKGQKEDLIRAINLHCFDEAKERLNMLIEMVDLHQKL